MHRAKGGASALLFLRKKAPPRRDVPSRAVCTPIHQQKISGKADASAHIGQRHDAHAHGSGHGRLADLVLGDGRRGADHHRTGRIRKDEHDEHDPEHRGAVGRQAG